MAPWLTFPRIIVAPSPVARHLKVNYRVSGKNALKGYLSGRRHVAFELWSLVLGMPPPVPNVDCPANHPSVAGLMGIGSAHACFKGVRRPFNEDNQGDNVFVYVTKPSHRYVYRPEMVTVAWKENVPDDLVFVTCVCPDEPFEPDGVHSCGVVTHWGFFECDEEEQMLPVDFGQRYRRRLW